MTRSIYLKPTKGARVLNPDARPPQPLPDQGLRVPDTLYWQRKLLEGAVELVLPPKANNRKAKEDA